MKLGSCFFHARRAPVAMTFVLLRPRVYWRVAGVFFLFVALTDAATVLLDRPVAQPPGVRFDWTHEILITLSALGALVAGFGRWPPRALATAALVFGAVYGAAGVLGFLSPTLFGLAPAVGLLLDAPDNLSHVVFGAWGVAVGLVGRREGEAP